MKKMNDDELIPGGAGRRTYASVKRSIRQAHALGKVWDFGEQLRPVNDEHFSDEELACLSPHQV